LRLQKPLRQSHPPRDRMSSRTFSDCERDTAVATSRTSPGCFNLCRRLAEAPRLHLDVRTCAGALLGVRMGLAKPLASGDRSSSASSTTVRGLASLAATAVEMCQALSGGCVLARCSADVRHSCLRRCRRRIVCAGGWLQRVSADMQRNVNVNRVSLRLTINLELAGS